MKKLVLILIVVSNHSFLMAQTFFQTEIFNDGFSDNNHSWSIIQNSTYSSNISNDLYTCNLPRNNPNGWRWTYVGIPQQLSDGFNRTKKEVSLSFDYLYSNSNNPDHFGFIFDLHNVKDGCPGGDGYSLIFSLDNEKSTITPEFFGTQNCNSVTTNFIAGQTTSINAVNHIIINKIGFNWNILINDKIVLNLKINGDISIDRLKFGYGRHVFDNFRIVSKELNTNFNTMPVSSTKPTIWAICVGINDYSNYPGYPKSINNLSSSALDATKYNDFLKSFNSGLIPPENIKLLLDKDATQEGIINTIINHFSKANLNDLVVLFLSGHGGPNSYYCSSNGPLRYADINKAIELSKASKKLLLADACHSGNWATAKKTVGPRGTTYTDQQALELFYQELAKSNSNITYILAARPDEYSWENLNDENNIQIQGGTFTHYLIKGLSCEAKNTSSGQPIIYVEDIFNYLFTKISNLHKGQYYYDQDTRQRVPVTAQHPVLNPQANLKMPIAICNN